MAETQCNTVSFPHRTLRSLLSDAIVELCRREAFYVEELRIEGTICVVSDRSSALIVQITEQVGNKTSANGTDDNGNGQLPVIAASRVSVDSAAVTVAEQDKCAQNSTAAKNRFVSRRLRSCRHCGVHFVRLGSLRSHIRRRHPLAVLSARNERLSDVRKCTQQADPAGTAGDDNRTSEIFNQNTLLMKSEPGFSGGSEPLHGFPTADINLGLHQMVRTLTMMSSLPINNNNGQFPVPFAMAASAGSDEDPIELRRSADGKFACPYCTKTYGFKHSLKEHIDVHRGRRPHVCRHCGASFAHLASLCAHIRRRHDDRMPADFRCSLCGEKLMNLQSLKQHRTWRHKDAPRLSDPLPPVAAVDFCKDPRAIDSNQTLPGGKKDGRSVNFAHLQRSGAASWPAVAFPGPGGPCGTVDLQSKLPASSVSARMSGLRKETTATDLPSFDGFDLHGYLSSVSDFQPVTGTSWPAGHVTTGHVTTPAIDTAVNAECQNLVSANKYFPETPELPAPGHSQSKTPANLQYRPSDGIPEPFFMPPVCPGCSAKFRTDADYRRHITCHPDHVTLAWRQ